MSKAKKITVNSDSKIFIKGARTHNLKNIDVEIPRNKLVVVTGVSGSGKSSLTIDTLYAEGQRRYVESLSSYVRQFMSRMDKPDVDYIKGLSPAIAIEQKTTTGTTRSTVGTLTEIYDYLRLLYAKIGKTYSPVSGKLVQKQEVSDVIDYIKTLDETAKIQILSPLKEITKNKLETLLQDGIQRLLLNGEVVKIEDYKIPETLVSKIESDKKLTTHDSRLTTSAYILIDRATAEQTEDNLYRLADSVSLAFSESGGECVIDVPGKNKKSFSNKFELDGIAFEIPSPQLFNFNSPYGACSKCEGFGTILGIDQDLVIPNKNLSVYEDAVVCWRTEGMSIWKKDMIKGAAKCDFPIHKPIIDLSKEQYKILWNGNEYFQGINAFFKDVESQTYKIQYRVMLAKYRGRTACDQCGGTRLRPDTEYVKVGEKSIGDLLQMTIKNMYEHFRLLKIDKHDTQIASRILLEINNRLQFMVDVGLEYLSLNRFSNTLSGGESQRINLTRTLGSNLTGSLYILDEPSVGLHPHDTGKLISILKYLRDLGNTVIVVEHEEEAIRSADYLIDVGPFAGTLGGEIVFAGNSADIIKNPNSLTTQYLTGKLQIEVPKQRRKPINFIEIKGAKQNNLKGIDVKIPLNALSVITGVSGSGKTTLIKQILYPYLKIQLEGFGGKAGLFKEIIGYKNKIKKIEFVDQNPIGRSSRSNPVTYIKAYDAIRDLFSSQSLSKIRGYQAKHFSFNVEGGRCDACEGEGEQVVEMQFLADVHLVCEVCNGKRFKQEILEVNYNGKNIAEILDLTVDEAIEFFAEKKDVVSRLKPLQDVGLGYVHLGQSSSTLSGGEAQRVKLASFLTKGVAKEQVLFIFDEPTTGLHFHDINKLLKAFNALIEIGHTVVVVEHNIDVIKCADWIIDLGPKGGEEGGHLVFEGTPENLIKNKESITAIYLKEKL
ncbi:MAG TPA: excinuclease ABC subunit UvrA [Chitinophagales bacterium]|nr:excinuclease ABC subunit UvrA [Chitinophagales bacterium]